MQMRYLLFYSISNYTTDHIDLVLSRSEDRNDCTTGNKNSSTLIKFPAVIKEKKKTKKSKMWVIYSN